MLGSGSTGSVQEALAGLLPAAGCAPLVPVLNAVHFAALLSLPAGLPAKRIMRVQSRTGA